MFSNDTSTDLPTSGQDFLFTGNNFTSGSTRSETDMLTSGPAGNETDMLTSGSTTYGPSYHTTGPAGNETDMLTSGSTGSVDVFGSTGLPGNGTYQPTGLSGSVETYQPTGSTGNVDIFITTDSPEIWEDAKYSDMKLSVLIMLFIFVNLILLIFFLLICIYAHKIGPKKKDKDQLVPDDKKGEVNPSFEISLRDELPSGSHEPDPEPGISVKSKDTGQSLTDIKVIDKNVAGADITTPNVASAVSTTPNVASAVSTTPNVASAVSTTPNLAGTTNTTPIETCEHHVIPQPPPLEDVNSVTEGQKHQNEEYSPSVSNPRQIEPEQENVYTNQLAISLARAVSPTGTPTVNQDRLDQDSDDERDYVNVPLRSNPEVDAVSNEGPDYVNVNDFLDPVGSNSDQNDYVNVTDLKPPSYLDVFKSDAKQQMHKFKRLSQRLGELLKPSDVSRPTQPLSKKVLQAGVPLVRHETSPGGEERRPNYVNENVV